MKQPENHEHLNMLDSALKLLQNHETLSWISLILFIRIGSWTTGTRRFQVSAKRRPEISSWRWFSWECPSVDLLRSSSSAMATLGATTPVPSASDHHTLAAVHPEHTLLPGQCPPVHLLLLALHHFLRRSVHARRCVIRSDCHRTLHGHLSSIRSSTIDQEMDCNPAPKFRWPSHWLWSASLGSCSASLTPVVWPPHSLFTCIFTTWIPTSSYAWEPSSTFRPFTSFTSFVSRSITPYWILNSAKLLRGN